MSLFDVLNKREVDDTGLPKQASDEELLAWSLEIRSLPDPAEDLLTIDYKRPAPARARRPRLVAAPQQDPVPTPRRVLRARPLVAAPATELDFA